MKKLIALSNGTLHALDVHAITVEAFEPLEVLSTDNDILAREDFDELVCALMIFLDKLAAHERSRRASPDDARAARAHVLAVARELAALAGVPGALSEEPLSYADSSEPVAKIAATFLEQFRAAQALRKTHGE